MGNGGRFFMSRSRVTRGAAVADDLDLDPVGIVEIEPAAWLVIGVAVRLLARRLDPRLGRVEIVDDDADMVQPADLRIAVVGVGLFAIRA